MNDSDRKTFKLKKNQKKEKDKDSNSSRESLEMEIKSYKKDKNISEKKIGEGEEIKFFFNEPPTAKKNNVSKFKLSPISSIKTSPHSTFNLLNENNESNFKDILLHYVKSPKNQTKMKKEEKEDRRSSVIFGNPQTVLTLNGDESLNGSEIKEQKGNNDKESSKSKSDSDSSSIYESNSRSKEESFTEEKSSKISGKIEEKNLNNLKVSKETSYKINNSKYDDSMEKYSNSNHTKKINDSEDEDNEKNEISNSPQIKIEKQENENNNIMQNKDMIKKLASIESNVQKSNKDSCFNSYKNSHKMKSLNSNALTTTTNTNTNTHNYQISHNSSNYSLKNNSNKKESNYLYLNDLSFKNQIIIKNRSSSNKSIISIKDLPKEDYIKDENTSIMLYKLKNLNISLDIEKSYCEHFKYLANLQSQKSHYKNINSNQNISDSHNQSKKINESNVDSNFYYPDEYYINKTNSLHKKAHVSNFFDKLRKVKKNV